MGSCPACLYPLWGPVWRWRRSSGDRHQPPLPRNRDCGRSDEQGDPPEHGHPRQEEPGVLNRCGQPGDRDDQGVRGREADDEGQPSSWNFRPHWHPPRSPRYPQIEVTFQVNADGMLEVNAKDKASDREEKIVINKNSNSLSPEDIEKMLADAEKFAEEDREVA